MTGAKIENLQALRGVAALLVLLSHVADMEKKYGSTGGLLPNFENEGSSGIYLFFVISGFIIVTISRNLHGTPHAYPAFLYRRVVRIYPLYWVISLVVLSVWLVRPAWVNSSMGGNMDLVSSFLLLPQKWLPLLGQGWTLVYEVYFYVFFAFSLLVPRRFLPWFLGTWAVAVLLGVVMIPRLAFDPPPVVHVAFSAYAVQFLLGAVSAMCVARTSLWAGASCFVGGCLGLGVFLAGPPVEQPAPVEVFLYTVPVLAIVHGAVAMELRGGILLPSLLRVIGDSSYSLYLSHILVISAIGRAWRTLGGSSSTADWTLIILMIVGGVVAGYACYVLVERPLMRVAHRADPWRRPRVDVGTASRSLNPESPRTADGLSS